MTALFAWIAVAAGWTFVALMFARSTLLRWSKSTGNLGVDVDDKVELGIATIGAIAMGLIWPLTLGFYGLRSWMVKPAEAQNAKNKQMFQDREDWYHTSLYSDDPQERETAKLLVKTLDDLLEQNGWKVHGR
jgi:hypothetical protein